MRTIRSIVSSTTMLVLVVLAVAGCAPEAKPEASAPPAESTPSASPSATAVEPDDTLFTVAAKVRAVDGTTMEIALVGHVPIASTDPAARELAREFVERCATLGGTSATDPAVPMSEQSLADSGSSLMLLEFSATPDGHTFFAPLDLGLGSQYAPKIAFGESTNPLFTTPSCLGQYQVTGSGQTRAITDYKGPSGNPDPTQWVTGYYGFSVPANSGASIESCSATVEPLGLADSANAPGWDQGALVSGVSCGIGYIGE